jgi:hypothetical protein
MGENLALFSRFYHSPSRAASDALDNGSVIFAVGSAAVVLLVWRFAGAVGLPLVAPSVFSIAAMFLAMTPVAIAAVAAWDGLGSAGVVLRREYVGLLVSGLFSWSTAYLPFGLLSFLFVSPYLPVLAHAGFLALFVLCLRVALGTSVLHAAVATVLGWVVALGIELLWPLIGGFGYFLLSPWILFILFRYYSPDVRSLGDAMNSRRSFRRQLEASMINPRDADAHFQLGLIYEQRRQYDDAVASFRRAVAIEPQEADAQLHLGRALRAQGQASDALVHIKAALAADPRVSSQEGWRDLGAALLELGRAQEACDSLERYTTAREYDPEGLFYYGLALRSAGRTIEARQTFEQAIAAVQTAPKYRRGQLRRWASQAKSELKSLKGE